MPVVSHDRRTGETYRKRARRAPARRGSRGWRTARHRRAPSASAAGIDSDDRWTIVTAGRRAGFDRRVRARRAGFGYKGRDTVSGVILDRRQFFASSMAAAAPDPAKSSLHRHVKQHPLAITMWDFSWLERRWPGAGYEDWDLALKELKERGYDAVRIDAYPHLIQAGATRTWELLPHWWFQDWGAASRCRVRVQPNLNEFIRRCAAHGICVGLSSWFRQDLANTRMKLAARLLGAAWKARWTPSPRWTVTFYPLRGSATSFPRRGKHHAQGPVARHAGRRGLDEPINFSAAPIRLHLLVHQV